MKKRVALCVPVMLLTAISLLSQETQKDQSLKLEPNPLSFDSHAIGTRSLPQKLSLTNNTGSAAKVRVTLALGKGANSDYFVEDNDCNREIPSGASCSISVSFLPLAEGPRNGTLEVAYSDTSNRKVSQEVNLKGSGGIPDLSISSTQLYFEQTSDSGASTPQTLTITNNSLKELTIRAVNCTGDFLAKTADLPHILKHGEFLTIAVSFTPTAKGNNAGTLTVLSSDSTLPEVYLNGSSADRSSGLCLASPSMEILGALVLSLLYWLTMVVVRWHRVAHPTRELLAAQIASIDTEITMLPAGPEPTKLAELLRKASQVLDPGNPSRGSSLANFLFWSRGQEIAGWGYVHEVQIKMSALLAPQTAVARLESVEQQLRITNDAPCLALANSVHQALTANPADVTRQRALLAQALNMHYDRIDTSFADLVSWQNKTSWLVSCGLALTVVLTIAFPHHFVLFLVGAAGGLISRLSRSLDRKDVPTDYGASWTTLFLSPVAGALGAWAGILISGFAVKLNVLGQIFNADWSNPYQPTTLAIALLFGFSERLLDGVLDKLVEKSTGTSSTVTNPQPAQKTNPPSDGGSSTLRITTQKLNDSKINQDFPSTQVEASGAKGDLTWSTDGTLPTGLVLNASSGVITGKPTEAKTFSFTIKVVDKSGQTASAPFSITISS
jgi:hypothetical protein